MLSDLLEDKRDGGQSEHSGSQMMMSLRPMFAAGLAMVCVCGSALAEVDPAAQQVLQDSRDAIKHLHDVSFKAKRSATGALAAFINADGEAQVLRAEGKPSVYHAQVTIQQPSGSPEVVELFVDGNDAVWLDAKNNTRKTRAMRSSESTNVMNQARQILLDDWHAETPYERELSGKATTIKLDGIEEVRGRVCDKVVVAFDNERQTVWFIDSNDHLPRKKIDQAGTGPQSLAMILEMWDVKVDAGLKAADLAVALPTGYFDDKPAAAEMPAGDIPEDPPALGLAVGETAPAFSLKSAKGGDVSLAAHEGHVVVLNFLGSWNAASMKAAGDLNALAKDYAGKGVAVLGISASEPSGDEAKAKLGQAELGYDVGLEGDSVATQYMVSGVPSYCVIDKNGKVAAFFQGYPGKEQLSAAVDAALGQ